MRKVTKETAVAFNYNREIKMSNTSVKRVGQDTFFYLHNNLIAKKIDGKLFISNAGWQSNTTKERLNGILYYCSNEAHIWQKNFQWYITLNEANTIMWDGQWIEIA